MFRNMNCNRKNNKNIKKEGSGFILLEILITIALIGIVFFVLLDIGFLAMNNWSVAKRELVADSLIKEELEALRGFRDKTKWNVDGLGLVNTGQDNPYYLVNNQGKWTLVSGEEIIEIFKRKIIFENVSRTGGKIDDVYNPANNDPDTKKVTVTVKWPEKSLSVVSYLTNWKND